jgi:hypothetical protein
MKKVKTSYSTGTPPARKFTIKTVFANNFISGTNKHPQNNHSIQSPKINKSTTHVHLKQM